MFLLTDRHTYERSAITRWLQKSDMSPLTGEPMRHKDLVPNYLLISSLSAVAAALSPNKATSSSLVQSCGNQNTIPYQDNNTSELSIVENDLDDHGVLLHDANKNKS